MRHSSLAVSWWVYDRSDLHSWQWLLPLLPPEMQHWALLHAGFDESAPTLTAALGTADAVIDVSPGLTHVSRSRRARRHAPAATLVCAEGSRLPIATGTLDAVLLVFAAHEVRDATQREALFDELRRVVGPAGRVIIVEHLRDHANVVAFGPGAWHFQTRREWTRLAARSGFDTVRVVNQSAFVRGFALWAS